MTTPGTKPAPRSANAPSKTIARRTSDPTGLITRLAEERVAIEGIDPEIDGGRFPAKAIAGQPFVVEVDVFGEGHDLVDAAILWRKVGDKAWSEAPLELVDNQRWRGAFTPAENAAYEYTIIAWRDVWEMWRYEVSKKQAADVPITLELEEGVRLVAEWRNTTRGSREDKAAIRKLAGDVARADDDTRYAVLIGEETAALMKRAGHRSNLTAYPKVLRLTVDRPKAAFSAWYELMPRSMSGDPNRHGTFDDVIERLPYVRGLGFDVLYFPPIHPIGKTNRKGKNNTLTPGPDDPGSPYAIGSEAGGHDALHPELGDFDAFKRLVDAARESGLEIALDYALNCSPDHPWIKEHHDWFDWRPDGSIRYAENPPKKYEDIVNVRFYDGDAVIPSVWIKQRDVFLFWISHGVKIFRVDNPHTKAYPFWEWVIADVQQAHPEVIFLAEAFTRPKIMHRLAKVGFTQSYSYFTWRNTKAELTEYMLELTRTEKRHTMRVNFFVNTPDINPVYLQQSGRPGHQVRLVLAASLAGNYGIYSGFELCEATPIPGREEYLNSEKYEIRAWDWDRPGNIREDVALMNKLRHAHPALQEFANIEFYNIWNDNILYYGKRTADKSSFLLFAVNLDPHNGQGGNFEVPLWELGLPDNAAVEVEDLVSQYFFTWQGKIQHVHIEPHQRPYFIWRLIAPEGHN